ncbi:uncharacterized protein LOC107371910 [Tetranychus urticae]|uniref:uncharacterized protein LOC107371910 n=1 Tax=Tetranychus urticae TaxID=32264 RepID=UPI00077BF4C0|nr:uncharacterized protein LOC107371910 [Tetranychus urticae]
MPYDCENCAFTSYSIVDYVNHVCATSSHHEDHSASSQSAQILCYNCDFSTLDAEEYLAHSCETTPLPSCSNDCLICVPELPIMTSQEQNNTPSTSVSSSRNITSPSSSSKGVSLLQKVKKTKFCCDKCKHVFSRRKIFQEHIKVCGVPCSPIERNFSKIDGLNCVRSAMHNKLSEYTIEKPTAIDLDKLQKDIQNDIYDLLKSTLDTHPTLKFNLTIEISFEKVTSEGVVNLEKRPFVSVMKQILRGDDLNYKIASSFDELKETVAQYTERGSGWSIVSIDRVTIHLGRFKAHAGGCFNKKLPALIINKKCLLRMEVTSDCFMYSVLASLHPKSSSSNPSRRKQYDQYINLYDFSDVRGIVTLDLISKFEKKNNLCINVYTYDIDESYVIPLKINKQLHQETIKLFLYDEHFYPIRSFNRLASADLTKSRHFCEFCMNPFTSCEKLDKHKIECVRMSPGNIIMPERGSSKQKIKFKQYKWIQQFPFVIYADFETLSVNTQNDYKIKELPPCSYGLVVVDWNGVIIKSDFCRGPDVVKNFLPKLFSLKHELSTILRDSKKPLIMTDQDDENFVNARKCFICGQGLWSDKVKDHDHLTGKYRGAAHSRCNLALVMPDKIPIIFHNLKNFDGHIIFENLSHEIIKRGLTVIPHTMEKYTAFLFDSFIFLDSFSFLPASLESLAESLTEENKQDFIKMLFPNHPTALLTKKAALPYEYIDSHARFEEDTLPSIDKFYSSLSGETISTELYNHLELIWKQFNCKTLGDFHDIYLKVDVLLLTAVFENFRGTVRRFFNLDPCHLFSSPGLSWAGMLKFTGITLDLMTHIDMLYMIEKGIRGGPTSVADRHCTANNENVTNFDANKPRSFIKYFDVNNLYGYAMSQKLPIDEFSWYQGEIDIEMLLTEARDTNYGYIFEVDLEYPAELHDQHNDFPLAPHKMEIDYNSLSDYQKDIIKKLTQNDLNYTSSEKLVLTFLPHEKYVVHYATLDLYLKMGMKLKKVHRVIRFRQGPWLAKYVEFCTKMRQQATTAFEKDFWKLMVNSIYGKTIEDKRKHRKICFAFDVHETENKLRSDLCKRYIIMSENRVIFELFNTKVEMNKPIMVGFTVLEMAKLKMYEIHYNSFKKHFGEKIKLLYTDTDSLIYNIKSEDIIKDMESLSSLMDYSNYPNDHVLFSNCNLKKVGYLKDEMAGKDIEEFVALKPKLYAIKVGDSIVKRAKGVQKSVLKKKINFDDYLNCLYNNEVERAKQTRLGSNKHVIYMFSNDKILMSPLDDKRFLINNTDSLAYGHYKIRQNESEQQ